MTDYKTPADEVRERGLQVGDTIEGRYDGDNGWWHIARLTLLWVGEEVVVWRSSEMSSLRPTWSPPRETYGWTLIARDWKKVTRC